MKVVIADGFEFRFSDAIDAYVFDEKDSSKATFHGAPMKGLISSQSSKMPISTSS